MILGKVNEFLDKQGIVKASSTNRDLVTCSVVERYPTKRDVLSTCRGLLWAISNTVWTTLPKVRFIRLQTTSFIRSLPDSFFFFFFASLLHSSASSQELNSTRHSLSKLYFFFLFILFSCWYRCTIIYLLIMCTLLMICTLRTYESLFYDFAVDSWFLSGLIDNCQME